MTGFVCLSKNKKPGSLNPVLMACPNARGMQKVSGQLLIDECGQLGLAHGAHFGGCQLTAFEYHERWNATNTEFGGDVTVVIHVHFGDLQFAFVSSGHFVKDGGDHFARATPLGPKVNDHRLAGMEHVGFKCGVCNVFDQIAGHDLFLMNNVDAAKVAAILTETRRARYG